MNQRCNQSPSHPIRTCRLSRVRLCSSREWHLPFYGLWVNAINRWQADLPPGPALGSRPVRL